MWRSLVGKAIGSGEASMAGQGLRGAVIGWYLLVVVVDEKKLSRAGVRVGVQMERVAVGEAPGGFVQAVGIRTRSEWCRHNISRRGLVPVGISGQLVQSNGKAEVLVEGQEVWEEWITVDGSASGGH